MAPPRKLEQRKSRPITVHFTDAEYAVLKARAAQTATAVAVLVHDAVLIWLEPPPLDPSDLPLEPKSWREEMGLA